MDTAAIVWGAAQLMIGSVQKIADAQARISFFGAVPATAPAKAFEGALPGGAQAPPAVGEHINAVLGRAAATPIDQDAIVEYLLRDVILERLIRTVPDAGPLLEIFAGSGAGGAIATAKVLMRNINAFVPKQDGSGCDVQQSLRVVADGLQAYIDARVQAELRPILKTQLGATRLSNITLTRLFCHPSNSHHVR